jgi:hypothetical protein
MLVITSRDHLHVPGHGVLLLLAAVVLDGQDHRVGRCLNIRWVGTVQ